jgi:hypothetical protein
MDFLKAIASKLAGPGAYDEPVDTFKLYAPPSLWDAYTPEQQAAYGRQIQSQQRSINADYRPKYQDVQKGIAEDYANRAGMEATAAMRAELLKAMPGEQAAPGVAGGPAAQAPSQNVINANTYRRAGDVYARMGQPDKANQYFEAADKLDPRETYSAPTAAVDASGSPVFVQPGNLGTMRTVQGYGPVPPKAAETPTSVREAMIYLGIPPNTDPNTLTPEQRKQLKDVASRPNFQGVPTEGGGLSVLNTLTGEVSPAKTLTGETVQKPLKEFPATVANGFIENQVSLGKINEAILATQRSPDSLGAWNTLPDAVRQRTDPNGVKVRAMISDIGSMKIHDRSGAAVSASEFPRLRPFVPAVTDAPDTVVEKLRLFKQEYEAMQQGIQTFYSDGYKQPAKPPAQPVPTGGRQTQPAPTQQASPQRPQPATPSGLGTGNVAGSIGALPSVTEADIITTHAAMLRKNPNITRDQVIDMIRRSGMKIDSPMVR